MTMSLDTVFTLSVLPCLTVATSLFIALNKLKHIYSQNAKLLRYRYLKFSQGDLVSAGRRLILHSKYFIVNSLEFPVV